MKVTEKKAVSTYTIKCSDVEAKLIHAVFGLKSRSTDELHNAPVGTGYAIYNALDKVIGK
jgi:hypothetical protein